MPENPFDHSTLTPSAVERINSTYTMKGDGVMLRAPAMLRIFLPVVLILSSLLSAVVIMVAIKDFPLNLIVTVALVTAEIPVAGAFWFYYNTVFICADDNGVTKSQWGKARTVTWNQISSINWLSVGQNSFKYFLRDAGGETIMDFHDLSDGPAGGRLRDFIVARLNART